MSQLAEVHTIYETNASDIAAMLRQAADNIEAGEPAVRCMVAVAELKEGGIQIFGWGKTDTHRSIALLRMGAAELIDTQIATWKDDE